MSPEQRKKAVARLRELGNAEREAARAWTATMKPPHYSGMPQAGERWAKAMDAYAEAMLAFQKHMLPRDR